MVKPQALMILSLAVATATACSESSKTTPARKQIQPAGDTDQSADQNNKNNVDNAPLDCEGQWALALRQQPQGSTFIYKSTASLFQYSFTRSVRISSATSEAISQSISIDDSFVNGFSPQLSQQSITLQKSQFIQACQTEVPQPLAINALGGQLVVKSKSSQVLAIQGQSIPVEVIEMDLANVSYGTLSVSSGSVTMYVSSRYPALPIKQTLSINFSSQPSSGKLTLEDTLESPLPVVN